MGQVTILFYLKFPFHGFQTLYHTIVQNKLFYLVILGPGHIFGWSRLFFFEFLNLFSVGFSTVYETTVLNKKTQFWSLLLGPIFGEVGNWVDYLKMFAFKTLN